MTVNVTIDYDNVQQHDLARDIAHVLNAYCAENVSGTPDFILAEFLLDSIRAFNSAVVKRADWRGEVTELPALTRQASADSGQSA